MNLKIHPPNMGTNLETIGSTILSTCNGLNLLPFPPNLPALSLSLSCMWHPHVHCNNLLKVFSSNPDLSFNQLVVACVNQVYSKLWKFQQENRHQLVDVGLKRWEIGEIASRIGQLYYNYYLRTSDAKFLSESYIFYEAILIRDYFKDNDKDASLANKQLRYCARFIVICLLLNRREMVHSLVRQLRSLVDEFTRTYQVQFLLISFLPTSRKASSLG